MINYLQFKVYCSDQDEKDKLVAILSDYGFDGFEETPDCLMATGTESSADISNTEEWLVKNGYTFEVEKIPEQNWNALWESNFSPVVVNDFVAVRAHFHEPVANVQHELIITPKMSFGTGHHATTNLMIRSMQNLAISGRRVFDFGTGTGVLAILAAKMGALKVEAIDIDSWSIENAHENVIMNGVGNIIHIWQDESPAKAGEADVILANINKHIILQHLGVLKEKLAKQGFLVLSGLLADDEAEIETAARESGLIRTDFLDMNNWISLVYRRMDLIVN